MLSVMIYLTGFACLCCLCVFCIFEIHGISATCLSGLSDCLTFFLRYNNFTDYKLETYFCGTTDQLNEDRISSTITGINGMH
uniref:Secreted protein n=1 Tax=Rhizophora mucronata TaxID=61149 RepID=A0A2P2LS16_RHIMU